MKSNLWALVVCVMLTLSLASCGEKQAANQAYDKSQNEVATAPNGADEQDEIEIVTGNNDDKADVMGNSAVKNPAAVDKNNTSKTETNLRSSRSAAQNTPTWDHLLQNGHIRDTDGDLTDGENSSWR